MKNLKDKFNLQFWQNDYVERFQLNREGREILKRFIFDSPEKAKGFIIEKYAREVYREDIIDTYCSMYNRDRINEILQDLEYEKLTDKEVEEYGIIEQEEAEEFER